MTIYTIKLSKQKIVAAVLIVAALIAAIILLVPDSRDVKTSAAASAPAKVKSSADCVDYAASLGYQLRPEAADKRQVTIPEEFDEIYTRYNQIQKDNGHDLEQYCGKGVTLYTFYVTNYAGHDDVLMDVLVYKSKVVGGAVYTAAIDGFMHGLCPNPTL